ncbi:pyridoxamine 5'-phosphate oxidase family protein [Marivita sp. GX14005]|uniref:pyridoxamine 5'-phosphate oxidase family protein n=1 Tax=Marivita sp. GX14005 TaxID=2942276 RepID=UPI002019AB00|nr:pyridoxamine 5'-phosphate oxidase family protein [Marivita sp. GX14005]MCL3881183.1 pyridoxamine 5'-phosphate oxidase family protein [Marivita sp. GX14005]
MTDKHDRFWEILDDMRVCMITTEDDGLLRSRPMAPHIDKDARTISFITDRDSAKVHELRSDRELNLSFADNKDMVFASVSGKGFVNYDKEKLREMWGPYAEAFFGDDPDKADAAIITVQPSQAEYWDSDKGKIASAIELTKSYFGDEKPDLGENKKLNL